MTTSTPRASVHASTGLNMGRQGTLAYWLVHMLSFVTGRLDVEGGNLKSDGFYPNARSGAGVPEQEAALRRLHARSEAGGKTRRASSRERTTESTKMTRIWICSPSQCRRDVESWKG